MRSLPQSVPWDACWLFGECSISVILMFKEAAVGRAKTEKKLLGYFSTLKKQDGVIDFNKNSSEIHAFVRAMSPWPSAYAFLNGETFKLFSPKIVENLSGVPGEILVADKNGLVVATKDSAILFDEIQAPTQKRMSVKDYLLGHKLSVGDLFKGLE